MVIKEELTNVKYFILSKKWSEWLETLSRLFKEWRSYRESLLHLAKARLFSLSFFLFASLVLSIGLGGGGTPRM